VIGLAEEEDIVDVVCVSMVVVVPRSFDNQVDMIDEYCERLKKTSIPRTLKFLECH